MSLESPKKNAQIHTSFKEKYSLEDRVLEAKRKKEQNPSLIPLVVEKHHRSRLPTLSKIKFLVSEDLKFYEFQFNIKAKLKLDRREALYFFVADKKIDKPNMMMGEIYKENKDVDEFLYITYAELETFGA